MPYSHGGLSSGAGIECDPGSGQVSHTRAGGSDESPNVDFLLYMSKCRTAVKHVKNEKMHLLGLLAVKKEHLIKAHVEAAR